MEETNVHFTSLQRTLKNCDYFPTKGFSVVNETEVDDFMEFLWFLYDPMNAGNLISGSSAFSKPSLNPGKFSVHIKLKPNLEDFKHNLSSMGDEFSWWCEYSLIFPFLGIGMRINIFQSCDHCWVFQIF